MPPPPSPSAPLDPSDPRALLKAGRLAEALTAVQAQARAKPADPSVRIMLFQLYSLNGHWEKALDQLNIAMELDSKNYLVIAQAGGRALNAMALRDLVLSGERPPMLMGEPEEWMSWMIQAFKLGATGQHAAAAALRARALEAAPAQSGTINGEPFQWLADADLRFGPIMEVILDTGYYWVPMNRLLAVTVDPPEHLHDSVWLPANLRWSNGGESIGLLPVRYPASEASPDAAVRLAKETRWQDLGHGVSAGLGQRLLASDAGDYPLMDVRSIVFEPSSAAAGGPNA